jgi:hypothetical protein
MLFICKTPFMTLSAAICLLFASSCSRYSRPSDSRIDFDTIIVQQVFQSEPEKSPLTYSLDVRFVFPAVMADTARLARLQAAVVSKFFIDDYSGLSPQAAAESMLVQQRNYFLTINPPGDWMADTPHDSVPAYYLTLKNDFVFQGDGLLSFTVESESFEGGAHPQHNISGYVYNLATGSFLSEDAFAGENYRQNIGDLITAQIAEMHHLDNGQTLEDIGFDANQILPNGNFTVDSTGITYYYNEYEIAPYYIGDSRVFIPFSELKVYIRPDSPLALLIK